jgi:uncharacterized RDD family membrane protein YckC
MTIDVGLPTSGSAMPQSAVELVGARFGVRSAARVIDFVVHYIIWFSFGVAVGIGIGIYAAIANIDVEPLANRFGTVHWYAYALSVTGAVLYHTFMEGMHGATVGKRLLGLIVISANGQPLRVPAALGRSWAFYIDGLFFGLVAYSSMEPPLQQRYGDKWCSTVVVKRSSLPIQAGLPRRHFGQALLIAVLANGTCFLASTCIALV